MIVHGLHGHVQRRVDTIFHNFDVLRDIMCKHVNVDKEIVNLVYLNMDVIDKEWVNL